MSDLHLKIRIKIGDNEFEADGPADIIQNELIRFNRSLGLKTEPSIPEPKAPRADIEKVSEVNGRIVSLKGNAQAPAETILAILLGQQLLRNNTKVMGSEIMAGLRRSGITISRADYILRNLIADASVATGGSHRRRRYRLTNRGIEKAQEVARSLAAALAEKK